MDPADRSDIRALDEAFHAAEDDARRLVEGVSEELGTWRASSDSWSVAECLDHLASGNAVYLQAMRPAAERALGRRRRRRGPARPGVIGRWFVWTFEPPVNPRFKLKAPRAIRPRVSPPLGDAFARFLTSQNEVRSFLRQYAEIDLAGVRFRNPFFGGFWFSLATGLHVLAAHGRRHLQQARRVRREAEQHEAGQAT